MPGNNFPPLCEFAFIRLQRGHLERLWQEKKKSWRARTGERNEHGGGEKVKEGNTGKKEDSAKECGNTGMKQDGV